MAYNEENNMFDRFSRPSPALVLAFVALFAAIAGGAYAAKTAKKNSVATKSIKANAVTNVKIAPDAVTSDKVLDDSLTGADIKESTLGIVPDSSKLGGKASSDRVCGDRPARIHKSGAGGRFHELR